MVLSRDRFASKDTLVDLPGHPSAGLVRLVEQSLSGACVVQRGGFRYVNARFASIFGYSVEELTGWCTVRHLVVNQDLPRLRALVRQAAQGGDPSRPVLLRGLRKDGQVVYLEANAVRTEFAHEGAIACSISDVTARVRAELARAESEERFSLVMRATGNVTLDWDLASNVIRWNSNVHTVFHYDPADVSSTYDWWVERIHHDDRRHVVASIESALGQEGQLWTSEYRFRRGDGSYASVLGRASIVRNDDGVPVRLLGAMVDVTEHRQLEERFYLSQRMESVGRLAGGVAHDFNNVLMVIQGTTDLLLAQPGLSDALSADLGEIRKAAERATALTRQLLAFGRRQVLRPQVVNLNDVVGELEGMLHRVLGEDIALVSRPDEGLGMVRVDPRQFEQVLINLVANARDAMPHGGRLTLTTENVYLTESDTANFSYTVLPGRYVRVSVRDTGTGIAADTLTQIFEPFFTTKETGRGTGLGLATVYGIIKQSGGYIWVESEVGEGAAFHIYLPRTAGRAKPVRAPEAAVSLPEGTGTILLVEDEDAVRSVTWRILDRGGYTVLSAGSGEEALRICAEHGAEIDALVTDVVMPGMSGRELADRVAATYPKVKVLFMSGHTDDRMVQHGVGRGEVNFLQKPFRPERLLRRVQALMEAS